MAQPGVRGPGIKGAAFPYKPHWNLDGGQLFKDVCLLQDASADSLQAELGASLQCSHINRLYLYQGLTIRFKYTSMYAIDFGA